MQEGLVQVQMRLDETGKRDAPVGVDLLIDLLLDLLLNGNDPAIGDSNVHERLFVADPYPADDHIHLMFAPVLRLEPKRHAFEHRRRLRRRATMVPLVE